MNLKTQKITVTGLFIALFVLLFTVVGNAYGEKEKTIKELELPTVGTVEKLQELLKDWNEGGAIPYPVFGARTMNAMAGEVDMAMAEPETPAAGPSKAANDDYSATNTQVEGVDEADLVKTDGTYIYKVASDKLQIIQAVPANQMKLTAEIDFDENNFTPQELYVDANRIVLVGEYWEPRTHQTDCRYGFCWNDYGMRVLVYDTSDMTQPRLMRQADLPGRSISTRKVGDYFYFALGQDIDYFALEEKKNYLPTYQEQTFGTLGETTKQHEIALTEVKYFPDHVQPQYLMLGAMQIQDLSQPMQVRAYLGDGSNLYANQEHMYVALTEWQYDTDSSYLQDSEVKTGIYRFALDKMKIVCDGQGEVPGTILNQFSMDENKGYFRIATTTGNSWSSGEDTSKNNLYILNSDLKQVGALTGIAPGEEIYSVRFMGDRAYMVTFRTVDPFFVLDLSQPGKPVILGKLKIPGYSDYLHPYDENHIIGFGKETIELKGAGEEPTAYYLGMKVALFDVTDVTQPVEMSKVTIGDRGTYSELLNNHKALLFDRSKNLLAFPVTVMSLQGKPVVNKEGYPNYGDFSYQGAYIYHLDTENGFDLQGRITHLREQDYQQAGSGWYDSDLNVQRILFIGDQLYTISDQMIRANKLDTLTETGSLLLEQE